MNYKQKLGYIALGGVLMLIGIIVASVVTPNLLTQKEVFGEITCTGLRVVKQDGKEVIRLRISESDTGFVEVLNNAETPVVYLMGNSDGGGVRVFNKSGVSVVSLEGFKTPSSPYHDFGGVVMIADDAGKDALLLSPNKHGGRIFVYGKHTHYLAELAAEQFGGYLTLWNHEDFGLTRVIHFGANSDGDGLGKIGNKNGAEVLRLSANTSGGFVTIRDNDLRKMVQLKPEEHGGRVDVFGIESPSGLVELLGNDSQRSRATIGVNQYGHGTIATWDKHGNRTRP